MAKVFTQLFGDWNEAQLLFADLPQRLRRKAENHIQLMSQTMAKRLRDGLYSQRYVEQYGWPALSEYRRSEKERKGLDPRTLLGTNRYVDSIKARRVGPGTWAVGVEDEELATIARAHEFGSDKENWHLPARPFWRMEQARIVDHMLELRYALEAEMRRRR